MWKRLLIFTGTAATALSVGIPQVAANTTGLPKVSSQSCAVGGVSSVTWEHSGSNSLLDTFWSHISGRPVVQGVTNLDIKHHGSLSQVTPPNVNNSWAFHATFFTPGFSRFETSSVACF
jgi:hypothetical protein